jgi:hypothetical protein
VKALFDTNILIDYLCGCEDAHAEIGKYEHRLISVVTVLEIRSGVRSDSEDAKMTAFLGRFETVGIGDLVIEECVRLRRNRRIKLADAIVWASARANQALLVTRDGDFPADDPGVRHPYRLED